MFLCDYLSMPHPRGEEKAMRVLRHFPVTDAQRARDLLSAASRQRVLADMREVAACVLCAAAGAGAVLLLQLVWGAA